MKIYTKQGDKGETSLVYGSRVLKNDIRVEAYGTVDEINSTIGLAISHLKASSRANEEKVQDVIGNLRSLQTALFHVGAEISTPPEKEVKWKVTDDDIKILEEKIDTWDSELSQLTQFLLPGGTVAASTLHVARTVARRAERHTVGVEKLSPLVIKYLNRLSDYLFIVARYVNFLFGEEEPILHK